MVFRHRSSHRNVRLVPNIIQLETKSLVSEAFFSLAGITPQGACDEQKPEKPNALNPPATTRRYKINDNQDAGIYYLKTATSENNQPMRLTRSPAPVNETVLLDQNINSVEITPKQHVHIFAGVSNVNTSNSPIPLTSSTALSPPPSMSNGSAIRTLTPSVDDRSNEASFFVDSENSRGEGTGRGFVTHNFGGAGNSMSGNSAPSATDDHASAFGTLFQSEDTEIGVLLNDSDPEGDPLTIISFTQPSVGSVKLTNNKIYYNTGTAQPFYGDVEFNYTISDGHGNTATAKVTVLTVVVNVDLSIRENGTLTPSPESSIYNNVVNATGTAQLGPQRLDHAAFHNAYVDFYEVVGTVNPGQAGETRVFTWSCHVRYRAWMIQPTGNNNWVIEKIGEGGFPDPQEDGPDPLFADGTPDPTSHKIFMADAPGQTPINAVPNGTTVRSEKQFTIDVYTGGRKAGTKSFSLLQNQKKNNDGDWEGTQNTLGSDPLDGTINNDDANQSTGAPPGAIYTYEDKTNTPGQP